MQPFWNYWASTFLRQAAAAYNVIRISVAAHGRQSERQAGWRHETMMNESLPTKRGGDYDSEGRETEGIRLS